MADLDADDVQRGKRGNPRKRGRNTWGSTRQLRSGRWQARYPGPDGQRIPAPDTFPTKGDALGWLDDKRLELRQNGWHNPNAGTTAIGEYADDWLRCRPELAPRTIELYEDMLRLHIKPQLADVPLRDLTPPMVRRWRAGLLVDDVGEVSVIKAYRLLRTIMNTALEDGEIRENPCRIKGAGTQRAKERRVPTMEQVATIADTIGPRWRALVLLTAFAALRFGEVAGLRRRDLNLRNMTVRIERTIVDVRGTLTEGPPKSDAGRRTVHLPAVLKPELQRHLKRYSEPGPDGHIFTGRRGGVLRRSTFGRTWRRSVKKAGCPHVRFHDLRHAGGTWAAQAGATLKELQERLGHSTPQAAMIYQHAVSERGKAIADALSAQAEEALRAHKGHDDDSEDGES